MASKHYGDTIDLSSSLLRQLSLLYLSERESDLVFIVDRERLFAHKFVLVLRCEYFRLMFASGLRESLVGEVEVKETPLSAFKAVLYFMYSGKVLLHDKKFDDIIDILCLGHRYSMHELVDQLAVYLENSVSSENVCHLYQTATLFGLHSLVSRSQHFLLSHGFKVLEEEAFYSFSAKTIMILFSSDDFCAEEINIFKAILKYFKLNPDCDEVKCDKIISTVRLSLICWNDLIAYVWPSGLYGKDDLLDAIQNKTNGDIYDNRINYRKCVTPIRNLPSIIPCIIEKSVIHRTPSEQTDTINFVIPGNVTIQFDCIHFINYIGLRFGNCESSGYSYYIEVATDGNDWRRIVDYTDYHCHSNQEIYFAKTPMRYVRIYGTRCKGGGTRFIITAMQCMIRDLPSTLYISSRNKIDLDYSTENKNKFYSPLYGPQIKIQRSKSSSKISI